MNFKCKKCGANMLEVVETAIIGTVVQDIDKYGYIEYGEQLSQYESEIDYYQCATCGEGVDIDEVIESQIPA